MSVEIHTPITEEAAAILQVGDTVTITGYILCGRDAVLPKVIKMVKEGKVDGLGISLQGNVIFHTAVSPAGVGPTSSNKLEIESSMEPLSKAGIKLHLGKGAIHKETVEALHKYNAVYAVIPPVTALLTDKEACGFPGTWHGSVISVESSTISGYYCGCTWEEHL